MSVSGTFTLTLHTPIGPQEGKMILRADGNDLSGTVVNVKGDSHFTGGTVSGDEIQFVAKLQTPLGRIKARVSGRVEADTFLGVARIPLGEVKIEGRRVADEVEG
jgi:hypothetical protein